MDAKKQSKISAWMQKNRSLAEKITDNKDDLTDILSKVNDLKSEDKGPVDGFFDSIKELYHLVIDWKDQKYDGVSKTTIITIIICFVYFVSPIDVIADVIPGAGLLDDALVLKITIDQIGADLKRYREWKSTEQDTP